MNVPRMHHFLPQGYLRGFTCQGHRSKKGKLRVFDLLKRKCFSAGPKDVAKVRDYYAFQNTVGEVDYRVETEVFQAVDSDAARILREIDENRRIPQGYEWEALAAFIAFLQLRTPHFRHANQEIEQHLFDMKARAAVATPQSFSDFKKAHEAETGNAFSETYEELKDTIERDGFIVEVPRQNDVMLMLAVAPQIAQTVRQMTPHLLVADGKGRFVTGDSPICFWDTDEERRRSGLVGVGWMTKEVEVTVPLTARCCLALNWDGQPDVLPASDTLVANCNMLRAFMTRQYLFAPHGDVPLLRDGNLVWGEDLFVEFYSDAKQTQPAIQIHGGPIPRRPPERPQR